ncbi:MAG: sigma-70 family RNA polymerase sigma factor [Clostridium sp.]|uniref:sigma-70 family RNA polymerase sigma factor n=1 Tax=Clostridium sp. TaxID=1506 RepID=UPI002906B1E7|nr:sigma-70 family RNA polymerase sigma factor [Clostridium sp.]MDU5111029.1 sigma-70 family RNA polymerase sigma factor [Clostridium sp.]
MMEVKELLIKAKDGNNIALEEIIKKHEPLIYNTMISFYVKGYDKEDIRQIATLSIIKAVKSCKIELSTGFSSYAKEIIRNDIYKEISKVEKQYYKHKESNEIAMVIDIKEIADESTNIIEDYIKSEDKEILIKEINLLEEEERALLKAIYVKNITLKKYAEEKGLEYHKARYQKDKIIQKLRLKLKRED